MRERGTERREKEDRGTEVCVCGGGGTRSGKRRQDAKAKIEYRKDVG